MNKDHIYLIIRTLEKTGLNHSINPNRIARIILDILPEDQINLILGSPKNTFETLSSFIETGAYLVCPLAYKLDKNFK